MKPIDFEGSNEVYAKDQPQYIPLPVYRRGDGDGRVYCIWKPDEKERKQIADGKNIGLWISTFHHPLQPLLMVVAEEKEKATEQDTEQSKTQNDNNKRS